MQKTPDGELALKRYPEIRYPFVALNSNLQPIAGGNSPTEAKRRGRIAGCTTPLITQNHTLLYPGVKEKFVAIEPNYVLVRQYNRNEKVERRWNEKTIIAEGYNEYTREHQFFIIDISPKKVVAVGSTEKQALENAIKSGCANPVIQCNWI